MDCAQGIAFVLLLVCPPMALAKSAQDRAAGMKGKRQRAGGLDRKLVFCLALAAALLLLCRNKPASLEAERLHTAAAHAQRQSCYPPQHTNFSAYTTDQLDYKAFFNSTRALELVAQSAGPGCIWPGDGGNAEGMRIPPFLHHGAFLLGSAQLLLWSFPVAALPAPTSPAGLMHPSALCTLPPAVHLPTFDHLLERASGPEATFHLEWALSCQKAYPDFLHLYWDYEAARKLVEMVRLAMCSRVSETIRPPVPLPQLGPPSRMWRAPTYWAGQSQSHHLSAPLESPSRAPLFACPAPPPAACRSTTPPSCRCGRTCPGTCTRRTPSVTSSCTALAASTWMLTWPATVPHRTCWQAMMW